MAPIFTSRNNANRGRREDRTVRTLIVEADIAARDGRVEGPAGFGHTANRFAKLPKSFRIMRVTKVQVIGSAQRNRARAGQIPRALGSGDLSTLVGIEINVGTIAIHR